MKTFNKTNIDPIVYKNETYTADIKISAIIKTPGASLEKETTKQKLEIALRTENLKAIIVTCLHPNLKGKTDLWGKPYVPNVWIFTNRKNRD